MRLEKTKTKNNQQVVRHAQRIQSLRGGSSKGERETHTKRGRGKKLDASRTTGLQFLCMGACMVTKDGLFPSSWGRTHPLGFPCDPFCSLTAIYLLVLSPQKKKKKLWAQRDAAQIEKTAESPWPFWSSSNNNKTRTGKKWCVVIRPICLN